MKLKKATVALLAGVSLAGAAYLPKQADQVQAKSTKKKSSEPFPKDSYPKVKYTNGKYGVETTASVKARIAWAKRHNEKGSLLYPVVTKKYGLNHYKKSRQKIVFKAVANKTKKVLFTVSEVREGNYLDTMEGLNNYFSYEKIPGSWYNYRIDLGPGPQPISVNWKNKKGIMYVKLNYLTTKQVAEKNRYFANLGKSSKLK